jgi:TetR/AcrR family transcriptional repressor of mexJK operon
VARSVQPSPSARVRGDAKRDEIRHAALAVFLSNGYLGTNVDQIAAAARTSKRTVYSHFGDKEQLFRDVIRGTIEPMQAALKDLLDSAKPGHAPESLRSLVRNLTTLIVTPQVAHLRRTVIAEAERFPDLAAEWYRLGPEQTVDRLADHLTTISRPARLRIDDARVAAQHLLWLAVSAPLNRLMFAPESVASPDELDQTATAAFEAFWRAYGPAESQSPSTK